MGTTTLAPASGARASTSTAPSGSSVVLACAGLSLLRCFTQVGIPLFIAEEDPASLTVHSRYARRKRIIASPAHNPEQAVLDLLSIAETLPERPMLAFDNEVMLLLASRHRDVLSRYYRFLLPSEQLVEDVTSKLRFATLAQELDLPVPRSIIPTRQTTVEQVAAQVGLPCVLKPFSHVGRYRMQVEHEQGRAYKVLQANTMEELRVQHQKMTGYCDQFLVQQYIPGDDGLLYSFHTYLAEDGHPLGLFAGRKIRTCPRGAGYSAYLELVHDPELISLSLQLLHKMHYVGPMKLDFKRHPATGQYYLLECNARFTLWNYLGAACGMNLPLLALADLYQQPVKVKMTYRTNVKWLSFGYDIRAFLREYRPAGEWTWIRYLWSLRGHRIYDVFSWRDPRPWAVCAFRYLADNWRKLMRRLPHRPRSNPLTRRLLGSKVK